MRTDQEKAVWPSTHSPLSQKLEGKKEKRKKVAFFDELCVLLF